MDKAGCRPAVERYYQQKEERKERKKSNEKGKENRRKKEIKKKSEGYYGHFTLLFTLHGQEKLFCQTFPKTD
jgi:hypothetical protein